MLYIIVLIRYLTLVHTLKLNKETLSMNDNFIHTKFGYCYYSCYKLLDRAFIYNLYVHPEYRQRGHAKKLLNNVIAEIKSTGITGVIEIESAPRENSISIDKLTDLYERLGLIVVKL